MKRQEAEEKRLEKSTFEKSQEELCRTYPSEEEEPEPAFFN